MLLNTRLPRLREGGFTLVELLVTILIVTVGLLGLAKLQAAAVSNTAVARTRSLMTFQAESLAGMIRANKAFWITTNTTATYPGFSIAADGTVNLSSMTAHTPTSSCVDISDTCTPSNLAYDDLNTWATAFKQAFPKAQASIKCAPSSGTTCGANPVNPHGYDITLTWDQKMVAVNSSTVNASSTSPVSIVLHIQP